MRKIKKFRIPIYTYDILRKAKKRKIDLFALGLADQESAKEYIASLAAALEPSTVFDLLAPGEALAGPAGIAQGGSGTLGVVTLGAAFEAKLNAVTDPGLFRLAETAALVFSETGLKVVSELIDQEISAEGLTLGDPVRIFSFRPLSDGSGPEPEAGPDELPVRPDIGIAAACLTRLSADKIGVGLNEGAISPRHTVIFGIPWLAPKKKKPAAGTASR
jgi:hypothetical protein